MRPVRISLASNQGRSDSREVTSSRSGEEHSYQSVRHAADTVDEDLHMTGMEKCLDSFNEVAVVATFFGGFGISDLSSLTQDRAAAMAENGVLKMYIMSQAIAVALNIFSAITMTFVNLSVKRIMADIIWKHKDGLPVDVKSEVGGQLVRAAGAFGAEGCRCNCRALMLANLSWFGVLLSIPLYLMALILKLVEAIPDDDRLVCSVAGVFATCVICIFIAVLRTNGGGPLGYTCMVDK